jgi:YHS domain-containing protein
MSKHSKILTILLAAAFLLVLAGLALQTTGDTAKDPVCGMTVKTAGAKYTYDYKGTTYYFCGQGCKDAFAKEPDKYLTPSDAAKPTGMMMGGMKGQMAGQQVASDTAKDPVCGMTVKTAGAKYTFDYKGTTYYFCGQGCKDAFVKEPDKYLTPSDAAKPMGMTMGGMKGQMAGQQAASDTAKDPVCGMTVKKADAKYTYNYMGMTYYFCSQGCKDAFAKEPDKYLKPSDTAKPMGGGMMMGGMHGQQAQMKAGGAMESCPMMLPDVDMKAQNTKDGVIITFTSKNAETIKKLQDHAAKMMESKSQKGGKNEDACPMGADCPMKKK